jgi:plastocyanin
MSTLLNSLIVPAGCVLLLWRAAPAQDTGPSGVVAGRVELIEKGGGRVPGEGSVVWVPNALPAARPADSRQLAVASDNKRFEPHVIAVPRGATVSFPNLDKIFHNAFSRTPGSQFDLGLYRRGAARSFTFEQPGLVRVFCNIHPDMAAYVMVLDRSPFAVAGADGSYRIDGVPAGRWVVRVWNEKGGEQEHPLAVGAGAPATQDFTLDATSYRWQPHANKYGQAYPPVTHDADRY